MRRLSTRVSALLVLTLLASACSADTAEAPPAPAPAPVEAPAPDAQPEPDDEVADLSGRTIRILVPFGPGGGADTAARLLAPLLQESIPGNPNVIVENRAGGGGAIGMNALLQEGDNGLFLVVVTPGITLRWATGELGHDYDLPAFQALAGVAGTTVFITPTSVASSVQDLLDGEVALRSGNPDPDSENSMIEFLAGEILGLNLSQTFGFQGYGETALAMARSEIGASTAASGALRDFQGIEGDVGGLSFLYQQGIAIRGGDIVRAQQFADIPTVIEAYRQIHGGDPTGEAVDIYRAIVALTTSQQNFLMHPDAPEPVVRAIAQGFEAAFASTAFKDGAGEIYSGAVPEILATQDVADIIASLAALPDAVREFISSRRG